MLALFVVTLILIGLRLAGDNSSYFQLVNCSFASCLCGYSIAVLQWQIIVMLVLLFLGEGYAIVSQFFTSLSLTGIIKKILTKV